MKTKIIATNETIQEIVNNEIKKLGLTADLNHIDTSKVTDMSYLFVESNFNGDISQWNVSNVENMSHMFALSNFNKNISQWDVSKVKKMHYMFYKSKFNKNISQWNVSNVETIQCMFSLSKFKQDISNWNFSKVKDMNRVIADDFNTEAIINKFINSTDGYYTQYKKKLINDLIEKLKNLV